MRGVVQHTIALLALLALLALQSACSNDTASSRGAGTQNGSTGGRGSLAGAGGSVAGAGGASSQPSGGAHAPIAGSAGLGDNTCARAHVGVTRLVPTVQVVVDASGSMAEPFEGCATRWDCLRDALIGEHGPIKMLEGTVSFGLTLYGGQIAKVEDGAITEIINPACPRLLHVPAALDNHAAIAERYQRANPGGGTPTAEALAPIIDALPDVSLALDQALGTQIILLVTDGDPNACSDPVETRYEHAEAEALRAQKKHIKLFALTVADDQNAAHLQRMANLGAGMAADADPGAPYFEPTNAAELSRTLLDIVADAVGCEVKLEGEVAAREPGDECRGEVTLSDEPLGCNDDDGWRLRDRNTLELQGQACERFKSDANLLLTAEFPCELLRVE